MSLSITEVYTALHPRYERSTHSVTSPSEQPSSALQQTALRDYADMAVQSKANYIHIFKFLLP